MVFLRGRLCLPTGRCPGGLAGYLAQARGSPRTSVLHTAGADVTCACTRDRVLWVRRPVGGAREHKLRVHSEFIFPHKAKKPAEGTNNYNRTCMPYPFNGELTMREAAGVFELAVEGFSKISYYNPGACWPAHTCLQAVCGFEEQAAL